MDKVDFYSIVDDFGPVSPEAESDAVAMAWREITAVLADPQAMLVGAVESGDPHAVDMLQAKCSVSGQILKSASEHLGSPTPETVQSAWWQYVKRSGWMIYNQAYMSDDTEALSGYLKFAHDYYEFTEFDEDADVSIEDASDAAVAIKVLIAFADQLSGATKEQLLDSVTMKHADILFLRSTEILNELIRYRGYTAASEIFGSPDMLRTILDQAGCIDAQSIDSSM